MAPAVMARTSVNMLVAKMPPARLINEIADPPCRDCLSRLLFAKYVPYGRQLLDYYLTYYNSAVEIFVRQNFF